MKEFEPKEVGLEMREAILKMQSYLDQGYLLHGSKKRLSKLEPRQASDDDKDRISGNQLGIYAEARDVRVPVVMALFSKKEAKSGWRSFYHGDENGFKIGGDNVTLTPGFVHVLPSDSFEDVFDPKTKSSEKISREVVEPIDIIPVDPSIIELLDINSEIQA